MNTVTLAARICQTIREHNLFTDGATIIVAISGGADSTALLDILANLPELSPRLVAAHLNHCLRGAESDTDEEFVRSLAEDYDIPIEIRRVNVREMTLIQGLNLEDAGRRARLAFFSEVRATRQAQAIALAHHADDQAETIMMRLMRGSGMAGLVGMSYRNDYGIIRPLLNISRAEIEAYLKARGLTYRDDASNRDPAFMRNRIRHELLPLLRQYNPAIRERLTTTAALLADENELLQQLTEKTFDRVCRMAGDRAFCNTTLLLNEPAPLRRRFFRLVLEKLAGTLDHFAQSHITALEQLIASPRPNAALNLPHGITATREYTSLIFSNATSLAAPVMCEFLIHGPGCYPLPDGGFLSITFEPEPPDFAALPPHCACFDPDRAPFPWHVRYFQPGDRIVPLGMTGSKKIKDIFIDAKIPVTRRHRTPLVFSGDTLIWLCGLRTSHLARVDSATSRFISAVYSGNPV